MSDPLGCTTTVNKSYIDKMTDMIAAHARMSLAIIIVLMILVIGIYIYYHGLFFIGPYAGIKQKISSNIDESETEQLIDSINKH